MYMIVTCTSSTHVVFHMIHCNIYEDTLILKRAFETDYLKK